MQHIHLVDLVQMSRKIQMVTGRKAFQQLFSSVLRFPVDASIRSSRVICLLSPANTAVIIIHGIVPLNA